ncbi:hypothetical protein A2U01_0089831, partial [Trifolium medium]|nr:hypothetical protein [Trifolium medium]
DCGSCWEVVRETPVPRAAGSDLGFQVTKLGDVGDHVGDEGCDVGFEESGAVMGEECGLGAVMGLYTSGSKEK